MNKWKNLFENEEPQAVSGSSVTSLQSDQEQSGSSRSLAVDEETSTGAVTGYQSPNAFIGGFDGDEKQMLQKRANITESAPPGWERVVVAMKRNPEIMNPFALAWAMKDRGFKARDIEEAINRWLQKSSNRLSEASSVGRFERLSPEFTPEELVAHNILQFAADNDMAGIGAFPQSDKETPSEIGKATLIDFDFPLCDGGKVACYVASGGLGFDFHVFKVDTGNRLERLGAEHNLEWDALLTKVQETYEATMALRVCDDEKPEDGMIERVNHGMSMPSQTTLPKKAKAALKEWALKNKRIISWKKH